MLVRKAVDKKTMLELELKEIYRQEEIKKFEDENAKLRNDERMKKLQMRDETSESDAYDYGISEYNTNRIAEVPKQNADNYKTFSLSWMNVYLFTILLMNIANIALICATLYWIKILGS